MRAAISSKFVAAEGERNQLVQAFVLLVSLSIN